MVRPVSIFIFFDINSNFYHFYFISINDIVGWCEVGGNSAPREESIPTLEDDCKRTTASLRTEMHVVQNWQPAQLISELVELESTTICLTGNILLTDGISSGLFSLWGFESKNSLNLL